MSSVTWLRCHTGRVTPKERVAAAVHRWGDDAVVAGCAELLGSDPASVPTGDLLDLAMVLGDLSDRDWLSSGKPPGHGYWARVWAARALRYVWRNEAASAVVHALTWRVREMAAKVVADREIAEAADALTTLVADDVPRVRKAAVLALGAVGEGEHIDVVRDTVDDPEAAVSDAAQTALIVLSRRLDRPVD